MGYATCIKPNICNATIICIFLSLSEEVYKSIIYLRFREHYANAAMDGHVLWGYAYIFNSVLYLTNSPIYVL